MADEETMRLSFEYVVENGIEVKIHWTEDPNTRYWWLPLSEWKELVGKYGARKLSPYNSALHGVWSGR